MCVVNNELLLNSFIMKESKKPTLLKGLKKVYKDKALSQATVWRWLDRFKSSVLKEDSREENIPLPDLQSIVDKKRSGRPLSTLTQEKKQKADEIIQANRRVTIDELYIDLDNSFGSVQSIVNSLNYIGSPPRQCTSTHQSQNKGDN